MTGITEFLTARLDEAERVASDPTAARLIAPTSDRVALADYAVLDGVLHANVTYVIADIAAKRAIIALHIDDYTDTGDIDTDAEICVRCQEAWPCETLRRLAWVHSEHPGHRQDWKP